MKNYLKTFGESMLRNARLRRDRAALNEMTDSMLADMGISRSMIDYYTEPKALGGDLAYRR